MRKKEIIAFSIFGFLLSLASFTKNFIIIKMFALGGPDGPISKEIGNQIESMNIYQMIAERASYGIFIFLLLYIGWKVAYGFLKLRCIIPITLIILLVPALIEFAFQPGDRSAWLYLGRDIIRTAVWIGIMKIYNIAWKKMQLKDENETLE